MKSGQASVNLVNEAFGLNQLVAPLLWLGKVPRGATIGIEEPEIHLHPRAQAALCDVFVEVATHEGKQLILTTHSEHILMGLLTAVADGRLKPDDLAVYEFQREGNTARVERLEVNEYGQIAGGLKGFLETDLDEIGEFKNRRSGAAGASRRRHRGSRFREGGRLRTGLYTRHSGRPAHDTHTGARL